MRGRVGVAVLAAFTTMLAAGCGNAEKPVAEGSPSPRANSVAAGPPWYDDVAPAATEVTVGADGTPCRELPISFEMPGKWKVEPVELDSEFAELAELGGAIMWCEIDAKPAGNVGFLRVWTVDRGAVIGARKGLEQFLAEYGKLTDVQYRETKAGPIEAIEATFLKENELTGEPTRGRALVVGTRRGTFLLTLGGADTGVFEAMLPAYQLAKSTFAIER